MAASQNNDSRWVLVLLLFPLALVIGVFLPNNRAVRKHTNKPKAHKITARKAPAHVPTAKKIEQQNTNTRKTLVHKTAFGKADDKPSDVRIIKMVPIDGKRDVPPPKTAQTKPKPRKKKAFDATKYRYPLPFVFALKKRESFYETLFAKARKFKITPAEKAFVDALFASRHAEAYGIIKPKLGKALRNQSLRYYRIHRILKFRMLGYKLLGQFERVMHNYLKRKGDLLSIPQKGHPLARTAIIMTNIAGKYPELFRRISVKKGQTALTPKQMLWLRTFFLARWMHIVREQLPLSVSLPGPVYRDFLEARVLFATSENARFRAVDSLQRRFKNYPYARVMGWLSVQTNHLKEARLFLKQVKPLHAKDTFAKQLLDKIKGKTP